MSAGVAEMLLQSHGPEFIYPMYILPALPQAWTDGSVQNLGARGGFEVSIWWAHGYFKKATIRSNLGSPLNVTIGNLPGTEFRVKSHKLKSEDGNLQFETAKGMSYTLTPVSRCGPELS